MVFEQVAPLRTLTKVIQAACYNRVRVALARSRAPLRIELPQLRLELEFQRRLWVGRSMINRTPLLVWTDFETRGRALHQPVTCQLHLYHFLAGLIMGSALEGACDVLEGQQMVAPVHAPEVRWL
ncbi:MAG TPA: hypothetical protein VFN52_03240 [Acidiferrobacteraceae bacterium]|nr:hypothetical protein [Acidiferrobacteraceae bacterium]